MIWTQSMHHRLMCLNTCSQGGLTIWGVCEPSQGSCWGKVLRFTVQPHPLSSVSWTSCFCHLVTHSDKLTSFAVLPPRDQLKKCSHHFMVLPPCSEPLALSVPLLMVAIVSNQEPKQALLVLRCFFSGIRSQQWNQVADALLKTKKILQDHLKQGQTSKKRGE